MTAISEIVRTALDEHRSGRLRQAEQMYREVLRIDPDHADALHLLGLIAYQTGELPTAVDLLRRAVAANPRAAPYHANLGAALSATGRGDEAKRAYLRALQIQPDFAEAHNNLGNLLKTDGELEEAVASYRRALASKPDYAEAYGNLGAALESLGRPDDAAAACRKALQRNPQSAAAHFNLGNALVAQDRLADATDSYRQAIEVRPDFADAHNKLGSVLKRQNRPEEAIAAYRRALKIEPDRPLWELRLATTWPVVFRSNRQIDRYRRKLADHVQRFSERDFTIDLEELASSEAEPPFGLMYQGRDDRPIKEAYAGIFRRRFPQQACPIRSGHPRVGFVVTNRHERIFLTFMRGVLNHIETDSFEVFVVCSRGGSAVIRKAVTNQAVRILTIPERFDRILDTIRAARFDLLYYWEVGTDSVNYFLPFFPLAPVQCTSAGIPVTSGIPAMDYYLSDALWETEGAEQRYTETLLRTRTNLVYVPRVVLPERSKTREDFGFSGRDHLYLCVQNIEKFHPDFDPVLAGILRRDGRGRIVIVEDPHASAAGALRERFAATIPDVLGRIVFLPRQTYADYLALTAASDVLLDTPHYGGGSTTYHGLALGRPIVTLPSRGPAGRTAYACYEKMEVTDCIARRGEEYVDIAVRLGTDPEYRADVARRIRASSPPLFENMEAVRELEQVLQELIDKSRSR